MKKNLLKTNCFDVDRKMIMDLEKIHIENYVATSEGLIEVPLKVIGLSKNLAKLSEMIKEK